MKHRHGERVLFLALVAAFLGCADPAGRAAGPDASRDLQSGPTPTSPSASSSDRERAALTKIARLVAVAMDNETARQQVKRAMKAAPFREHKLQLESFLRSKDGAALLGRMVALNGRREADVLETLALIRPLEFYMPVDRHRESWTGTSDVLVVSQLNESEPIVAFDKKGREVALDRSVAPAQPTLSIVPVETRFDQPMSAASSKNVRDGNGNTIGTLVPVDLKASTLIACDADCGGGVAASPTPQIAPGLYLEFSRILDMKEPWFRGDPEIEVHIQGPSTPVAPTYADDLSCSGERAYDPRKVFNQDTGFWEGRVLLFSADEVAAFSSKFNQGFHVFFWEDDNAPCVLKLDTNSLAETVRATAAAFSTVALKVVPGASTLVIATAFVATFFLNAGAALSTNDDFIGAAVEQTSAGYSYPGNTHVIMDGTTLNGRATIVYRP